MRDPETLNRILCEHQWSTSRDWASALDELQHLSDDEIVQVQNASKGRRRDRKTGKP